jgi:hypothetical protein
MQDRKTPEILNSDWYASHAQVGAELGISRQGAALVERRALEKLRKGLARRGFGPEVMIEALRHLDQARW